MYPMPMMKHLTGKDHSENEHKTECKQTLQILMLTNLMYRNQIYFIVTNLGIQFLKNQMSKNQNAFSPKCQTSKYLQGYSNGTDFGANMNNTI